MKEGIHPEFNKVTAQCVCGAKYEIYSTQKQVRLDICSACHPLFTGQSKLLDTEGRVDRFKKRYAKVAAPAKK